MNRFVYLSGPITGLTHTGAVEWRQLVSEKFGHLSGGRIRTMSPMRGKKYLDNGQPISTFNDHRSKVLSSKEGIYTRDRNDVQRADIMLVNLLGAAKVSIGTVIELGWADAWGIPVVLAVEEGNIHRHPILDETANVIVPTLDEAVEYAYHVLRDDTF